MALSPPCNSNLKIYGCRNTTTFLSGGRWMFDQAAANRRFHIGGVSQKFRVVGKTKGSAAKPSKSEGNLPSWAKPNSDELPPWARGEADNTSTSPEIPFYVYLLASAVTAIAAIGSVFEYVNEKPVFGVLNTDSIFYAPVLGFFVFTGIPTSVFLWFKSVESANKDAEELDKRDGYR